MSSRDARTSSDSQLDIMLGVGVEPPILCIKQRGVRDFTINFFLYLAVLAVFIFSVVFMSRMPTGSALCVSNIKNTDSACTAGIACGDNAGGPAGTPYTLPTNVPLVFSATFGMLETSSSAPGGLALWWMACPQPLSNILSLPIFTASGTPMPSTCFADGSAFPYNINAGSYSEYQQKSSQYVLANTTTYLYLGFSCISLGSTGCSASIIMTWSLCVNAAGSQQVAPNVTGTLVTITNLPPMQNVQITNGAGTPVYISPNGVLGVDLVASNPGSITPIPVTVSGIVTTSGTANISGAIDIKSIGGVVPTFSQRGTRQALDTYTSNCLTCSGGGITDAIPGYSAVVGVTVPVSTGVVTVTGAVDVLNTVSVETTGNNVVQVSGASLSANVSESITLSITNSFSDALSNFVFQYVPNFGANPFGYILGYNGSTTPYQSGNGGVPSASSTGRANPLQSTGVAAQTSASTANNPLPTLPPPLVDMMNATVDKTTDTPSYRKRWFWEMLKMW